MKRFTLPEIDQCVAKAMGRLGFAFVSVHVFKRLKIILRNCLLDAFGYKQSEWEQFYSERGSESKVAIDKAITASGRRQKGDAS